MGIFNKLEILHLHGRLLPLPWEDPDVHKIKSSHYGYPIDNLLTQSKNVEASMESIKLLFEREKSPEVFKQAFSFLEDNSHRYFLGYGFHPLNNKKLRLSEIKNPGIICTNHGPTDHERTILKKQIGKSYNLHDKTNIELLRDHHSFG